jgi:hypothetical protein
MPRALGQAAQGRLDLAQVITGFQGGLGLTAVWRRVRVASDG